MKYAKKDQIREVRLCSSRGDSFTTTSVCAFVPNSVNEGRRRSPDDTAGLCRSYPFDWRPFWNWKVSEIVTVSAFLAAAFEFKFRGSTSIVFADRCSGSLCTSEGRPALS